MAIQMRRGPLAQYDESKMVAGEWGISIDEDTNDQKAFIAFAPGVSKQVMMVEDAESQIAVATAEAVSDATEKVEAMVHGDQYHVNDYASGDGTTTAFTLTETPSSIITVYVDGAVVSDYTISGNVITFAVAPEYGQDNIRVIYTVDTSTDNAQYYRNQAGNSASSASSSASSASGSATTSTNQRMESEAWAVGTKDGVPVTGDDDQYQNYSKYYAQSANLYAGSAAGSASNASDSARDAAFYAEQAAASAAMVDAEKILGNFASYEATTTASKAYKVGQLLTYNGYLYRVTTAIASGGTITVDTNVVQTTVAAEVENNVLVFPSVPVAATNGDIIDYDDPRITADHYLARIVWANEGAITSIGSNGLVTTDGNMVLSGTCTAATTAWIMLVR